MSQCPVLEYLELIALTLDDYAKGRIGLFVYEDKIRDIKEKIDKAVIASCHITKERIER